MDLDRANITKLLPYSSICVEITIFSAQAWRGFDCDFSRVGFVEKSGKINVF